MKSSHRKLPSAGKTERKALGRARDEARFTAPPTRTELPRDYAAILRELKKRIAGERLRTVLSANAGMILLYWDIGRTILARQTAEGWGVRVIDRLSSDLRQAFPDMKGLSPRNLKYMRACAEAWPDQTIVQGALAQMKWQTKLVHSLPKEFQGSLPTIEKIESELAGFPDAGTSAPQSHANVKIPTRPLPPPPKRQKGGKQ